MILFWRCLYDVSDIFSPVPLRHRLDNVLQILKRIGEVITAG
jgi:hypothetical protein